MKKSRAIPNSFERGIPVKYKLGGYYWYVLSVGDENGRGEITMVHKENLSKGKFLEKVIVASKEFIKQSDNKNFEYICSFFWEPNFRACLESQGFVFPNTKAEIDFYSLLRFHTDEYSVPYSPNSFEEKFLNALRPLIHKREND